MDRLMDPEVITALRVVPPISLAHDQSCGAPAEW